MPWGTPASVYDVAKATRFMLFNSLLIFKVDLFSFFSFSVKTVPLVEVYIKQGQHFK